MMCKDRKGLGFFFPSARQQMQDEDAEKVKELSWLHGDPRNMVSVPKWIDDSRAERRG